MLSSFLQRNLPKIADRFQISVVPRKPDGYKIRFANGKVYITAGSRVSACNAVYDYLKQICRVQYSWCGNEALQIDAPVAFDGVLQKDIEQKWRVYMNYCTLDYSMCWWDFARWEREIDFMAMNGINMPLCVLGFEAVWYETLLEFGFTKREALDTISGPAFIAWQLMTNIDSYMPPADESYVYARLELGKKVLARMLEFGMQPIQQGFSGHVPLLLREKYPQANILEKPAWCHFPKTAQLDPTDSLFQEFGLAFLKKNEALLGNYHYIACDPFHEGAPPKRNLFYQRRVGKAINALYERFDPKATWVMQVWTPHKHIINAVPKGRLLLLDLDSAKTPVFHNFHGHAVIAGMLHNFGGKNAMQGKLQYHCANNYARLKARGANVVGSGMFMEGIEQNPVVYDLQFSLLTEKQDIDFSSFLENYICRRYGAADPTLCTAWQYLVKSCYRDEGYHENAVGSTLCARPLLEPKKCGPCDYTKLYYNPSDLETAWKLFLSVGERFRSGDGYQYDLCDITRQALSNRFHTNQAKFACAYQEKRLTDAETLAAEQMEILADLDAFLGLRKNFTLAQWINQSHALAQNDAEKRYFDKNARTLLTVWGDLYGDSAMLYDYAWREWNGLIGEFYAVRWKRFYAMVLEAMRGGTEIEQVGKSQFVCERPRNDATAFGRALLAFEKEWCETYSEYPEPKNEDVFPAAQKLFQKYGTV